MRGAAPSALSAASAVEGRSPRARGSRFKLGLCRLRAGSIPACAGQPANAYWLGLLTRVDPRVRGAAAVSVAPTPKVPGRSPRARGSPHHHAAAAADPGSIPACAGQPLARPSAAPSTWVDPRVRGAASRRPRPRHTRAGRSPRARGSLDLGVGVVTEQRSIPACAGQPRQLLLVGGNYRVDPRVRGAATGRCSRWSAGGGRSPRARGSLQELDPPGEGHRSIPACAGQPSATPLPRSGARVDPRVRGAAAKVVLTRGRCSGRSPRARGSPVAPLALRLVKGSIPACAGQPDAFALVGHLSGVDPRVRGAAPPSWRPRARQSGRSPRARGSRPVAWLRRAALGSIPACAGQPLWCARRARDSRVDPRVRGAAPDVEPIRSASRGRSPRARGSRRAGRVRDAGRGSIPACAGQPDEDQVPLGHPGVDPRVRGAAAATSTADDVSTGRSPRARGSHRRRRRRAGCWRSIPACAGQPVEPTEAAHRYRVDPRVRGAASPCFASSGDSAGRSPRARGSLISAS